MKGTGALTDGAPAGAAAQRARAAARWSSGEAPPVLEVEGVTKRYGGIVALDDVSLDAPRGRGARPHRAERRRARRRSSTSSAASSRADDGVGAVRRRRHHRPRARGAGPRAAWSAGSRTPGCSRRSPCSRRCWSPLEQRLEVKSTVLNAAPAAAGAPGRAPAARAGPSGSSSCSSSARYRDKFVKELSTGLRRIVDLACVLAAEPKVLLLDEPSSGIAQAEAEGLAPLLRRVRFETGCSILIIEHDMPLISVGRPTSWSRSTRGASSSAGTPEDVLNDERVIESYLGTSEDVVARSGRR